jgi:hypothetical protein
MTVCRAEDTLGWSYPEYIGTYGALAGAAVVLIVARSLMWAHFFVEAASALHQLMLRRIFWCPMGFFDTTPIGRILNRFSQDQNDIDQQLPTSCEAGLIVCVRCLSIVVLTCIPQPILVVAIVPLLFLFSTIREYFRRSSREAPHPLTLALTLTLTLAPMGGSTPTCCGLISRLLRPRGNSLRPRQHAQLTLTLTLKKYNTKYLKPNNTRFGVTTCMTSSLI